MTAMRASTKSYAEFRNLQVEIIRKNRGEEQMEDADSDSQSVSAEEVTDDEFKEKPREERRPLTQVLQLVKPVETRWNSTFYMMQR